MPDLDRRWRQSRRCRLGLARADGGLGGKACFTHAPEICVEVVYPGNTEEELNEKMALYFDACAQEVLLCAKGGAMSFFAAGGGQPVRGSKLCPQFPRQVKLR